MWNNSVQCFLVVYKDSLLCMAAEIAWLTDMNRTFFMGKDVCWCLSQIIPGILHETDTNNQIMLYSELDHSHCINIQMGDFDLFKINKCTNLEINEEACLNIVHILQHPTSCPTPKSTQTTMVNALKKNISTLPVGKYGQSTKQSTKQHHQANEGKSGTEAECVQALRALYSSQSKKKLGAEQYGETHFLSNKGWEKWIKDDVERETTRARQWVEDAEAAVQQEQENVKKAENARLTNSKPEYTFQEIMVTIGDNLSDLAISDHGEDGEDKDEEETEQGQLRQDDEPSWVMRTIAKTVLQQMENIRQQQMKVDQLRPPGCGHAADYFRETDRKYSTFEWRVPAVVKLQTDDDVAAPAPTTFRELIECLDIIPAIWQLPQGTFRAGGGHIRLCCEKPQSNNKFTRSCALCGDHFITHSHWEACWTRKPFTLHIASPAYHHIQIGIGQRHSDSSFIIGGRERLIVIVDVIYLWKAIGVPILLRVRYFLISVSTLWDMIICLCMCKGRIHHSNVLGSYAGCKTANTFQLCLPITVKWETKSYIFYEIH